MFRMVLLLSLVSVVGLCSESFAYKLVGHPRIFVNRASLAGVARRAGDVLSSEYAAIKQVADQAVAEGIKAPRGRFRPPMDMVCAGICYLVERELGHDPEPYAEAIEQYWGNGSVLGLEGDGYFGFHGMVYDWIYDSLSPEQRRTFGGSLGEWLRYYTDTPEIVLKNGHWWYNQTWGPAHLNTPNTRDGITPKLFVALALAGAGTEHEQDARAYLDSWARRVPAECIPAFDEMGGVWSESMGHGGYGPVAVIPWAFEAWRTATGEDLFSRCSPTSYLPEMTRWAVYLTVPFADHTAWIDDNRARNLGGFARVAPILAARYRDPVANWISDKSASQGWNSIPWNRFLSYDPTVKSATPAQADYPLAYHFTGGGHVYMRSAWDDPDATWAFFGAGPKFAGHSRDDEGHFLIARKGWLALRAGGPGHNDWDYYAGGSLAFNIVTIYNPDEKFRRLAPRDPNGVKNENDGGMIRYVYSTHTRDDRAEIVAYHHGPDYTYAAADLSLGYSGEKVREVTRQLFYLRGEREFFIVFDRIRATSQEFPRHFFLHMPGEPSVSGQEKVIVPGHVFSYTGNTAAWLSDPAGEEGVLSTGRSRAFMTTLLPESAAITKRGGKGHEFWGHPDEPTAQYNHTGRQSHLPPIVPWRLEVESPGKTLDEFFLHVIEIGGQSQSAATKVSLLDQGVYLGAGLEIAGTPVEVLFATEGDLTARVKIGSQEEKVLKAGIK